MTKAEYIGNPELLAQLPVFYQPWYLDIFGTHWDVKCFETEGQRWIFPFYEEQKMGLKLSRPPLLLPYYGSFCLEQKEDVVLKAEEPVCAAMASFAKRFAFFAISPHFSFDLGGMSRFKMNAKSRVTHLLDLSKSKEELLAGMNYMRRKNIKKAEKDLVLKENDFDVARYFDWINVTYQKRGEKQPLSKSFFEKYLTVVLQHNAGIANTIYDQEGAPVAMSLVVYDCNTAYSILGANSPAHRHNAATTALLWSSIQKAKELGCKIYDFEGSSIAEIADFFSKFGSNRVDYKGWEQTNSLLWKLKRKFLK